MGDDSLIPISDEQAKLGQELVKAVSDGSGYFTDILGDLPKDLIGYLIGDRVKAKRRGLRCFGRGPASVCGTEASMIRNRQA
jgi:hypothetical protein